MELRLPLSEEDNKRRIAEIVATIKRNQELSIPPEVVRRMTPPPARPPLSDIDNKYKMELLKEDLAKSKARQETPPPEPIFSEPVKPKYDPDTGIINSPHSIDDMQYNRNIRGLAAAKREADLPIDERMNAYMHGDKDRPYQRAFVYMHGGVDPDTGEEIEPKFLGEEEMAANNPLEISPLMKRRAAIIATIRRNKGARDSSYPADIAEGDTTPGTFLDTSGG